MKYDGRRVNKTFCCLALHVTNCVQVIFKRGLCVVCVMS